MDSSFAFYKESIAGTVLLRREGGEPVAKPATAFDAKTRKKVGVIRSTIGQVSSPLYVLELTRGVQASDLRGRIITLNPASGGRYPRR